MYAPFDCLENERNVMYYKVKQNLSWYDMIMHKSFSNKIVCVPSSETFFPFPFFLGKQTGQIDIVLDKI